MFLILGKLTLFIVIINLFYKLFSSHILRLLPAIDGMVIQLLRRAIPSVKEIAIQFEIARLCSFLFKKWIGVIEFILSVTE